MQFTLSGEYSLPRSAGVYDFDTIQKEIDRIRKEENKVTNTDVAVNIGTINGVDLNKTAPAPQPDTNYNNSAYYGG